MATIEDVATRAGVSVSTVSYALSGKCLVAEETRLRILASIDELKYHLHGLASKRSRIIGIHFRPKPVRFQKVNLSWSLKSPRPQPRMRTR
jgi:DNA-binding LacI/PurR family transcriptional regulator